MRSKWPKIKENLFLIEMWCGEGMKEADIAKKLGVSKSTFEKHKAEHSDLIDSLKKGKEIIDYEVENSLYKKCVGTYAKVDKVFKCKRVFYDEQGRKCEEEYVETVELDVFIPPDTTAIAIWLNNRKAEKWRRNANKEKLDEKKFENDKKNDEKKYW